MQRGKQSHRGTLILFSRLRFRFLSYISPVHQLRGGTASSGLAPPHLVFNMAAKNRLPRELASALPWYGLSLGCSFATLGSGRLTMAACGSSVPRADKRMNHLLQCSGSLLDSGYWKADPPHRGNTACLPCSVSSPHRLEILTSESLGHLLLLLFPER